MEVTTGSGRIVWAEAQSKGLLADQPSTSKPLGQVLSAEAQQDLRHVMDELTSQGVRFEGTALHFHHRLSAKSAAGKVLHSPAADFGDLSIAPADSGGASRCPFHLPADVQVHRLQDLQALDAVHVTGCGLAHPALAQALRKYKGVIERPTGPKPEIHDRSIATWRDPQVLGPYEAYKSLTEGRGPLFLEHDGQGASYNNLRPAQTEDDVVQIAFFASQCDVPPSNAALATTLRHLTRDQGLSLYTGSLDGHKVQRSAEDLYRAFGHNPDLQILVGFEEQAPESVHGQAGLLNSSAFSSTLQQQATRCESLLQSGKIERRQAVAAVVIGRDLDADTWGQYQDILARVGYPDEAHATLTTQQTSTAPAAHDLMLKLLDMPHPQAAGTLLNRAERARRDFSMLASHGLPGSTMSNEDAAKILTLFRDRNPDWNDSLTRRSLDDMLKWLDAGDTFGTLTPLQAVQSAVTNSADSNPMQFLSDLRVQRRSG